MYALSAGRPLLRRRPAPAWRRPLQLLAAGAGVFLFLVFACAQAVHGSAPGGYMTVTVEPGDTVWSIATARYPEADTREKVGEILAANGLRDAAIHPGERLKVPTT